MTYVLALLAGIAGAVIGYAASGAITAVIANVMGMSNFEGAVGYFAFLGVAPIGGLVGLAAGIWLVLRRRGLRGGAIAARGALVVAGIVGLTAAGLAVMYFNRPFTSYNALPPQLVFEIRLPAGVTAPADHSRIEIDLNTDKNTMPATLTGDGVRRDGGRAVITGVVELAYRTSNRLLVLRLPDQPVRLFSLHLRASPSTSDDFGQWQRVDFIDDSKSGGARKAEAADGGYEIRYYVEDRTRDRTVPIDFEIRLPEGTPLPEESSGVRIVLRTDDREFEGNFFAYDWRRQDGNRPVLVGGVGIADPRSNPRILLALPGAPVRVFAVSLPAPASLGEWQPAESVEEDGQPPRAARPDEGFEFRYAGRQ